MPSTLEMGSLLPRRGIALESSRGEGTMTAFFRKLSRWACRRRKDEELRDELQFHLDEVASARHAEGLPKEQATWAARRDLGNVTLLRENTRTLWTWTLL